MANQLAAKLHRGMIEYANSTNVDKPGVTNWPSSLSVRTPDGILGACARKVWYSRKGYPSSREVNPNYLFSAMMGDYIESLVVDLFQRTSAWTRLFPIAVQTPFYLEDMNLSGKIDIILENIDSGSLAGVDVKSVSAFKTSLCLPRPDISNALQCFAYLHHFSEKNIFGGHLDRWYILYVSRSETWELKSKKNTSPLMQIWDFCIEKKDDHMVISTPSGVLEYPEVSVSALHERQAEIDKACQADDPPPREYKLKYSEEEILGKYKQDKLRFKKDKTAVEKWLKAGAKEGELDLELGDFECMVCPYKDLCWNEVRLERSGTLF